MKKYFSLILLLCLALCATAQTPTLRTFVKIDTFVDIPPNAIEGKSYARCVIPTEFKTCVNCPPDTPRWLNVYAVYQLPPKYDTLLTEVQVYPEQIYYTLKPDKNNDRTRKQLEDAVILAPVYRISTKKMAFSPAQPIWEFQRKDPNALSANPADCIALRRVMTRERTAQVKVYELVQPAQRITKQNGTEQIEILPWNSPYLLKNTVPAVYKIKQTYIEVLPPRTCIKDSTYEILDLRPQPKDGYITRYHLVRMGRVTEWKEFYIDFYKPVRMNLVISRLREKGYYKGKEKEVINQEIRTAIIQFQKDNDLEVGRLDDETLRLLGVPQE
jgi:hypothetical protein